MDQDPDAPHDDATRPRLRTFRTSSDHPFLVLPGEQQKGHDADHHELEEPADESG